MRRAAAGLLVIGLLGTGCSATVAGTGGLTGDAVAPDRRTDVELNPGRPDSGVLQVPEGAVSDPGSVSVVAVEPPDAAPEGLYVVDTAWRLRVAGTTLVDAVSLTLPAAGRGGGEPEAGALARYDEEKGLWLPVPSTYQRPRVTGQVDQPGVYAAFRVDARAVRATLVDRLDLVTTVGPPTAPECTGELATHGVTVTASDTDDVAYCVGVPETAAQVAVADTRGSVVSVQYPSGWAAAGEGTRAPAVQAALDVVDGIALRPRDVAENRDTVLISPGTGLRLDAPPDKKGTVRVEPTARSSMATALAWSADVYEVLTAQLPWWGTPVDPAAAADLVAPGMAADDCRGSLVHTSYRPAASAQQLGEIFRDTSMLALGCLSRVWVAALDLPEWRAAGLQATLGWVQDNIQQVFSEVGPTIGPALEFPLFKIQVTQAPT